MKYRKKPVVIEAIQWKPHLPRAYENNYPEIVAFCNGNCRLDNLYGLFIKTMEGELHASPLDWIIKGIKGEFYPCKPDIFEETYEAAE